MSKSSKFYDDLLSNKSKSKSVLSQLYKKPKKDKGVNVPHFQVDKPNVTQQADLLFLPSDDGFKYLLNVVDIYNGKTDGEPLKTKDAATVKSAFEQIYKRKILKIPERIEVDAGNEFKGAVKEYFKNNNVFLKVAQPGRHRQLAIVERKNQTIGTAIHKRQTAQEIITGAPSTEWIEDINPIISAINRKSHVRITKPSPIPVCDGDSCNLLNIGDKVRIQLDNPISATEDEKRLHGRFRSSDIRWSLQVYTINNVILKPNYPPLYMVEGINNVSYTKNQLQKVSKDDKLPDPAEFIRGNPDIFKVKKIHAKKKIKNVWKYQVEWEGYPNSKDFTWQKKSELDKSVPKIVKAFEDSLKK
jgi:hypothetical protein